MKTLCLLVCQECGREVERTMDLPEGVAPPDPKRFLCAECSYGKSAVDAIDFSQIGRTEIARRAASHRHARLVEFPDGTFEARSGRAVYQREKDRAWRFKWRNGFTQTEWFARVDTLGWFCSFCGRELSKRTVMRWTRGNSKSLQNNFPACRSCHCKKIGAEIAKARTAGTIVRTDR